jgi:hypothetical protein
VGGERGARPHPLDGIGRMQQHVQELLVSSVQLLASLGGTSALDNGPPMPAGSKSSAAGTARKLGRVGW